MWLGIPALKKYILALISLTANIHRYCLLKQSTLEPIEIFKGGMGSKTKRVDDHGSSYSSPRQDTLHNSAASVCQDSYDSTGARSSF